MDARVRAASCRMADAPGVRVAGALEKPNVPARLRARLGHMPNHSAAPQTYQACVPTAAALKAALDQQAISVEFRPQVRLNDGRVSGLEALTGALAAGGHTGPDITCAVCTYIGTSWDDRSADTPRAGYVTRRLPALVPALSGRWCRGEYLATVAGEPRVAGRGRGRAGACRCAASGVGDGDHGKRGGQRSAAGHRGGDAAADQGRAAVD